MENVKIRDGRAAQILGSGPLSMRFKLVLVEGESKPYLVWADTLMYRLDGPEKEENQHPLDVVEKLD